MPSTVADRISLPRLVIFVVLGVIAAAFVVTTDRAITVEYVSLTVLVAIFFGASIFDAVREHPLFNLASAVYTALLFGLLTIIWGPSVFILALTGLAVVGVAVELYNYRHGTSYLRVEPDNR
ncbi:hypothetical protein ELS19_14955 [Halogeometricum borinquense]|uniref:Phosphatidate cytidylyltransferase n=1 Tax=Halogeometricum borinquense TaxID=60847 RepID=A0A482TB00_9EURY|nr:hypothetical protein [Halogeometricum borinquense]RYJ15114.1 hypothetical protein ELS19_14955 [Halogeometricum borinquense]